VVELLLGDIGDNASRVCDDGLKLRAVTGDYKIGVHCDVYGINVEREGACAITTY